MAPMRPLKRPRNDEDEPLIRPARLLLTPVEWSLFFFFGFVEFLVLCTTDPVDSDMIEINECLDAFCTI